MLQTHERADVRVLLVWVEGDGFPAASGGRYRGPEDERQAQPDDKKAEHGGRRHPTAREPARQEIRAHDAQHKPDGQRGHEDGGGRRPARLDRGQTDQRHGNAPHQQDDGPDLR
jgi:hypothetical protein